MTPGSESQSRRLGFVGIGAMGEPMAACLVKAGHPVTVFDNRRHRADDFVAAHGGSAAATLADLAQASEVVILILPNSAIVTDVLFGEGGLAAALRPGTIIIDMTSGVPAVTISLNERLARQDVVLFDAPVSGGVARAVTGKLTIMAGGEAGPIDAVMPILEAMGSVIRTGPIGTAHAMKALNNLVSAGGFLIGMEALLIGTRFGIDPETMVDILNVSTGMNNSTQKKFKQYVLSRKFDSGFSLGLGEGPVDRAGDRTRSRGQCPLRRPLQGPVGRRRRHPGSAGRPHGDGDAEREAGRPRTGRHRVMNRRGPRAA
jgi:3-hydroxyisobutyrate dehydrogenase